MKWHTPSLQPCAWVNLGIVQRKLVFRTFEDSFTEELLQAGEAEEVAASGHMHRFAHGLPTQWTQQPPLGVSPETCSLSRARASGAGHAVAPQPKPCSGRVFKTNPATRNSAFELSITSPYLEGFLLFEFRENTVHVFMARNSLYIYCITFTVHNTFTGGFFSRSLIIFLNKHSFKFFNVFNTQKMDAVSMNQSSQEL